MNKRLEYKTKLLDDKLAEVSTRLDKEYNDNLEQHRLHHASIQQNKDEINKLRTNSPETDTSLLTANIHNLQNQILSLQDNLWNRSIADRSEFGGKSNNKFATSKEPTGKSSL